MENNDTLEFNEDAKFVITNETYAKIISTQNNRKGALTELSDCIRSTIKATSEAVKKAQHSIILMRILACLASAGAVYALINKNQYSGMIVWCALIFVIFLGIAATKKQAFYEEMLELSTYTIQFEEKFSSLIPNLCTLNRVEYRNALNNLFEIWEQDEFDDYFYNGD